MNKEKLRLLIDYLEVLGRIEGNYHFEISSAIKEIEKEFRIARNKNEEPFEIGKREGYWRTNNNSTFQLNTKGIAESVVKEIHNVINNKEEEAHSTKIQFKPDAIHLKANKIKLGENITKE